MTEPGEDEVNLRESGKGILTGYGGWLWMKKGETGREMSRKTATATIAAAITTITTG